LSFLNELLLPLYPFHFYILWLILGLLLIVQEILDSKEEKTGSEHSSQKETWAESTALKIVGFAGFVAYSVGVIVLHSSWAFVWAVAISVLVSALIAWFIRFMLYLNKESGKPSNPLVARAIFCGTHLVTAIIALNLAQPYTMSVTPPDIDREITAYRADNLTPSMEETKQELEGKVSKHYSGDRLFNNGYYEYKWTVRTPNGETRKMQSPYYDPDNTTSKKVNSSDRAEIVADLNPGEKPYVVDKMVLTVPESYKEGDKLCFKQVDTPNETCKQNAWLKSTVSTIHIPKDSYTEYVEG
jgi:hypothetical protein